VETSLLELRQRRNQIVTELSALKTVVKGAGRGFNKDERERVTKLLADDEQLKAQIAEAEQAAQLDEQLFGRIGERSEELALPLPRRTAPSEPRAAEPTPEDLKKHAEQGFKSLGEQLQAVAHAAMNPHDKIDPRLVYHRWTERLAPSGMSEGAPSDGGFLVQQDFSSEIIKRMYQYGEILQRIRSIPVSANANGLRINAIDETSRVTGSRWGGVQVYWQNEADSPTAKKPKLRQMELNLKKLIGLAYATDELLQDAQALESVLMQAFSEEFSFMLEDGCINGTGGGQILGIMNSPCLVTVSAQSGQATKTVVKENIDSMYARMWGRSRPNGVWLYNQDVEPQLRQMGYVVGTGGYPAYMPPGGLSDAPYATLYGRPAIPVEYCATLGTTGDILFCDWSQFLMIDKGGMQSASSIHVRFINDESTFRWVYRTDGQPTWHNVLTPYKGTNTLSPFVALATR
jgi:HK97 family phage major capsid protein